LFAAVLAGVVGPHLAAADSVDTVQLVYHSDTRGYFLPCG
jgi:hypothetical protein